MREKAPAGIRLKAVACPVCRENEARPFLQVFSRRMVRCQQCGLVYRNPRPAAPPFAWSASTEEIDHGAEERVGARRSRQFGRFLKAAGRPSRLLDVGCGYGFFLKLAREAGWEAIGVDPDPQAIAYATRRLRVNALCGDLRGTRFSASSFELVTLWNVLECVPDPLELLNEVYRVLTPGGRVFIRTQNAEWHRLSFGVTRLARRLGGRALLEEYPYLTFIFNLNSFCRSTLRLLLLRAGFLSASVRNSPPIPGDPYLGLGQGGELMLSLGKLAVHGLAQGLFVLSGGRCLIGPSLEAWARREAPA
jgi:SAM-dependent methyltransferase